VTTTGGVFSSEEPLLGGHWEGSEQQLEFQFVRSRYRPVQTGEAKYWVMPLTNCLSFPNALSLFPHCHPDLDRHPLRIFPTPEIPEGVLDVDLPTARFRANSRNCLVMFNYGDSLGFIEAVADYSKRRDDLLRRGERNRITAVMVGELGPSSSASLDLEEWVPVNFLDLLSLAAGTQIGASWVELRDVQGGLVERIHCPVGNGSLEKGHTAIDQPVHNGIGRLLTQAQASGALGKAYVRAAIKHIILGGRYSEISVEDKATHLARALDTICEEYKLKKDQKPEDLLSEENLQAVRTAIRACARAIGELASNARNQGSGEADVLDRIHQRVCEAKNIRAGFSKAVVSLCEVFRLPDVAIMAKHYGSEGKWPEKLSRFRGTPMHQGYFDFQAGEADVSDVLKHADHIHDLLLRIMFRILGYDGFYQPPVVKTTVQYKADWVTPETPASQLGY
jgi:hypothetical protein